MAQLGICVSLSHKIVVRCWLGLLPPEDLLGAGESIYKTALSHVWQVDLSDICYGTTFFIFFSDYLLRIPYNIKGF